MASKINNKTVESEDSKVLTTDKIIDIEERDSKGIPLKRHEKVWFKNQTGIRKSGLPFAMTKEEVMEYAKCKLSVHHFAEGYCKIKRGDGTIGNMKLRDYQKDIIDLYMDNRFSILMASRQTGKCLNFNTIVTIKKENTEKEINISIGELYYLNISKTRKLTWKEKLKYKLYKIISKI